MERQMKTIAYIALGSNIGDKGGTLMSALKMMSDVPGIEVRRISQFIATAPVGGPEDQPEYLNAAAEIETTLSPPELLAALQAIEKSLGRDRAVEQRWGPRTCDLDILLMGDIVVDTPPLTIPHPRMHERLFVLQPLSTIAPHAIHPVLGKTIAELLTEVSK